MQHARGVGDDLHGFNAGDVVEEPAAAGVHQLRVALHLHQLEGEHAFVGIEGALLVFEEEVADRLGIAVEDDLDIAVAGGPDVGEYFLAGGFGEGNQGIAEGVEGLAQGLAPLLVPSRFSAAASAVGAPAFHAVGAAPGGVLD